jgi:tetratricopeptide (TPR) repeat protein
VDASVESERTLQRDAYSLDEILADLENARNKVNVVILDACRNNPLPSSSRSAGGTRGLAAVQDVPGDLFVMFSTAPGDVAEDGKGKRNSPFAEAFLKYIDSPEPVVLMASDVISETMARTNNAQRPFSRGSIISDKRYSLNPAGAAVYVASAFIPEGQSKPLNPAGVTLASTPEGQSKPLNPAGAAPAYTPGDQAQSFYKEGMTRYNAEEWDGAIVYFTKAVELDPKFTAAYYYRGGAYRNKGAHDHAIADLTKAIELDPKDAKAYVRRGTAYDSKGDYDRAFADYTKAIELDPKNSAAYSNRGFAYYGKGDYDRAIADWTETVRLDPDNEFAKVHLEAAKKKRGR